MIHFIPAAFRQIDGAFPQIANVLDAVVGGRVDLHDVRKGSPFCFAADVAFQTGISFRRAVFTVDRFRQNAGTGGFSRAAGTGKQVGVGCLFLTDLIPESRCDMRLRDHIVKRPRPPFPIQCLIQPLHLPAKKIPEHRCAGLLRHTNTSA